MGFAYDCKIVQLTCSWFGTVAAAFSSLLKSPAALQLENVALRHEMTVLQRSVKPPRLNACDRLVWVWLSTVWSEWRSSLIIVKPETVVAWHRSAFRML
jgi:hypothetical protein